MIPLIKGFHDEALEPCGHGRGVTDLYLAPEPS